MGARQSVSLLPRLPLAAARLVALGRIPLCLGRLLRLSHCLRLGPRLLPLPLVVS